MKIIIFSYKKYFFFFIFFFVFFFIFFFLLFFSFIMYSHACMLVCIETKPKWCVAESKIVFNAVHCSPAVSAATETFALAENVKNTLAMLLSFNSAGTNWCKYVNGCPNVFFGKVGFSPNLVFKAIVEDLRRAIRFTSTASTNACARAT